MLRRRKKFDNPLQQYWQLLVKRKGTILGCFAAAVLITFVYNLSLGPMYAASARILIEDSQTKWLGIQEAGRPPMDWYMTQFEILRSRPIITKVVQKLDLTRQYWSHASRAETLQARLLGRPEVRRTDLDSETVVRQVQGSVSIQPQTATGLVAVTVRMPDPLLARDVANGLVDTFIEENLKARMQLNFAANEYLTGQLQKISDRIRDAQRALEDFERSEGIVGFRDRNLLDTQQLSTYVDRWLETRTQRWEMEQRLLVLQKLVDSDDYSGIYGVPMGDDGITTQTKALFDAQLRLEQLQKRGLLEKHPDVIAARENLDTLKKRLVFESRAYIAGMKSELAALEERERSLWQTITEAQKDVPDVVEKQSQWDFLKRDVEIQRGFYQSYDDQLKKLQLADDVRTGSIRVVEAAAAPSAPYAPDKSFNLGVGMLTGLFLGVFLAFFREYLDDTIKTADDVQDYLELPVIGTIPVISDSKEKTALISRKVDTASLVVEAYRTLRTNLQFFETERPLQVILVTSAGPAEGKSTTVANIGLTLVQMGKRVCLIDTDLRKPILHKIYNKPNRYGVTSMFAGITDKKRLLLPCGFENLYLLPCGPIPPNPAELLASPRMEEALKNLRKDFDYIVLDSPPVLAVTDALVLSSLVDGVLLVIKAGEARIGTSQAAMDSLHSIKANLIGVVLNHFNYRQSGYYRHYSRYYQYGYGYARNPKEAEAEAAGEGAARP